MLVGLTLLALLPTVDPASAPGFLDPAALQETASPSGGMTYRETNFSYTYIEGNYRWLDSDDADDSIDGLDLRGSYAVNPNMFLLGSWSHLSDEVDLDEFRLGAGYTVPVSDEVDVYGTLSWVHAEFDFEGPGGDDDEDGFSIIGGARMWASELVEINGKLEYRDVEDSGFGIGVGARYYVTPAVSLGGEIETISGDEELLIGVRFQW